MNLGFVTLLLVCQLVGETLTRLLALELPGPVIGMIILFVGLIIRGHVPDGLRATASGFLNNLSLLFVPAGVGVVTHLSLVADEWLAITSALAVSAVVTIAVTALVMVWLSRLTGNTPGPEAQKED
ncbi:CidA/LrgA family protein [Rhodovibrio salinarum]|uniref:CidA/LrgA family protein n=1 Tax=Rhodovibrio salinarum TaxID=1087 RepID=A0A934V0V8_9PROT|nr:CidA/LrgA family protein [Rhodovibrio salinarum]MBK1697915.1 CidA/LrgA family protein [Rhodovibrio salinarum]